MLYHSLLAVSSQLVYISDIMLYYSMQGSVRYPRVKTHRKWLWKRGSWVWSSSPEIRPPTLLMTSSFLVKLEKHLLDTHSLGMQDLSPVSVLRYH